MNFNRYFFLSVFLFLVAADVAGQDDVFIPYDLEEIVCKERLRAEKLNWMSHARNETAALSDIHYQKIKWEIDPAQYFIKGDITYYFKSMVDNLVELSLDLTPDLQVLSIDRNGYPLTFLHTPDQLLTIDLQKSLVAGQYDTLTIRYEGMPPSNGFGSFEQAEHDGQPVIWTLSEPYGARDWWPAKQDLIDKIDSVDISITTPPGLLAASNGKLTHIEESNGKWIHHWRHRYPIASYLVALAVTNYSEFSDFLLLDNGDSIEILNYVYPENLASAQASSSSTLDIMRVYNELFGTYPFADEKYGHAQFGWGGGMEHQTMSFMGGFSYGLIAHEMAHQWFGDKVTCGSWKDIWLNEGFATYLTGLSLERNSPDVYWPQWKISVINSATSQPGGSVYVDDTTNVNRIFSSRLSYNKAAYLLHMLRWVTGQDAFFAACRDYLDSAGTAYDFGRTKELQAFLESRSGLDLNEFFEDWFYGEGYPSYSVYWQSQADSLVFLLEQQTSHPSVDFFEMPVPLVAYYGNTAVPYVAMHTYQGQRFAFQHGGIYPDSVRFDPDRWILSRDNFVQEWSTAAEDPFRSGAIHILPNPAADYIEIKGIEGIEKLSLITAQGQEIPVVVHSGHVNLERIPPGFYSVHLLNAKNEVVAIKPLLITR